MRFRSSRRTHIFPSEDEPERGLTRQRGSLLSETDGVGKRKGEFVAHPFGTTRRDTTSETRKYTGAPRDTSISLDHMGARFYAPDLGIWTAGDPVHLKDPARLVSSDFTSTNPYAYASQNPIIGVDEDGEFWHVAVGAAIGGLIGGGIEAVRQYRAEGKVNDWGKVAGAAAGGAVSGAITAAVPGAGVLGVTASNGVGSAAGGIVERAVASGGKDLGTVSDVLRDGATGAAMAGLGKVLKPVSKAKPKAKASPPLNSEEAFKKQYAELQKRAGAKPSSPGRMQQEVKRGQAPKDVKRVDPAHTDAPGQEPHVHFCDGTSCNRSGTTHDKGRGTPSPSNEAKEWLEKHGWTPPSKD